MYTISKGPSQIVAKTRRGLAQKLESLDTIRDMTRKNSDSDEIDSPGSMSPPRPVFQTVSTTNKRHHHSSSHRHHHHHQQPEILTRSQQELIKYVYETGMVEHDPDIQGRLTSAMVVSWWDGPINKLDSRGWQRVNRELKTSMPAAEGTSVTYYQDASPNPALQDFEPFDLEGWWGRRLYHTLTQSI